MLPSLLLHGRRNPVQQLPTDLSQIHLSADESVGVGAELGLSLRVVGRDGSSWASYESRSFLDLFDSLGAGVEALSRRCRSSESKRREAVESAQHQPGPLHGW